MGGARVRLSAQSWTASTRHGGPGAISLVHPHSGHHGLPINAHNLITLAAAPWCFRGHCLWLNESGFCGVDRVHRFASNTERSAADTSPWVSSGPACPLSLGCRRPFVPSDLAKDVCIGNGPGSQTSCLSGAGGSRARGLLWTKLCPPNSRVEVLSPRPRTWPYVVIGSLQMLFVQMSHTEAGEAPVPRGRSS